MTTSELINLLKEIDPDGTAHIRLPSGTPYHIELKDGILGVPYTYLDENGKFVLSTQGKKIEISTIDVRSFVEKNYNDGLTWEELEKLFSFELTYRNQNEIDARVNTVLSHAKDIFDIIKRSRETVKLNDESSSNLTNALDRKKKPGLLKKWAKN
jgi:hypothetical protein